MILAVSHTLMRRSLCSCSAPVSVRVETQYYMVLTGDALTSRDTAPSRNRATVDLFWFGQILQCSRRVLRDKRNSHVCGEDYCWLKNALMV